MKTFAIVVIYNGMQYDWITKCLSSLDNADSSLETIVIDNASTDESVSYIKNNFSHVHLIESPINLGFGGANNLGLRKALEMGGEYFFLLNQDAWIELPTISQLVNHLSKNREYGILSPLHLNGKGTQLDFNFSTYITPTECKNLYSDFVLDKVEDRIYESGFICAAAWLISKECLRIVGGFSPTFFHYAEDDNYIQRLKYKGLKIGVLPSAKIFHDREDREENNQNSRPNEKKLRLEYSNPFNNKDLATYLQQLQFKMRKNKLLGRGKYNSSLREISDFILQNKDVIVRNQRISISDQEYIFLND